MNALSVISLCISIITLSLTLLRDFKNGKREKSNALIKFLDQGDSPEMKKLRGDIYRHAADFKDTEFQRKITDLFNDNARPNNLYSDLETSITKVISFYDKWALLYNQGYLPKWAFDGARKTVLLGICDKVMFYIDFRKAQGNEDYAKDLLTVYYKIK